MSRKPVGAKRLFICVVGMSNCTAPMETLEETFQEAKDCEPELDEEDVTFYEVKEVKVRFEHKIVEVVSSVKEVE